MIDYAKLATASVCRDPYPFMVTPDLLAAADAETLAREFPTRGFRLDQRSALDAEKRYRSFNLNVVVDGARDEAAWRSLSGGWRDFVAEMCTARYQERLGARMGVDVRNCVAELRRCRYEAGCWIAPHTDRADKLLTQIIYFNPGWRREWGGNLLILRAADDPDPAATVVPRLATSAVILPSGTSWHAVQPVTDGSPAARRSVLLHLSSRR